MTKTEKKEAKKRAKLAKAAGMTIYDFNIGVVLSEDNTFRTGIRSGMIPYGDMIAIQIMFESESGLWHNSHITPTNARVLAHHLNRMADVVERN